MDCTIYHNILNTPTLCLTPIQHLLLGAPVVIGIVIYALVKWGMDKKKDDEIHEQLTELFKRP